MSDLERAVIDRIGDRRLIWFGIRAEDGEPLSSLPQLSSCHGVTAPSRPEGVQSAVLESMSGHRVDLDRYDIDDDHSDSIHALRELLLSELSEPCIVLPYRPSRFLSALHFANLETANHAGMFKEQHMPFEHKPWVETCLRQVGVKVVPWRYVADERHADLLRHLHDGPLIVRPNRGSGGVGLARVDRPDQLADHWPHQAESFASVAPFFDDAIPLNAAGCVFPDGTITHHPLSMQLIGLDACVDRPFGYCGNDFGAVHALPSTVVEQVGDMIDAVGGWLHSSSFVGAFGLDVLVVEDAVLFSEVNPRFQGSSNLQAEVTRRLGLPSLYIDHLAAFLGVHPGPRPSFLDMTSAQPTWSHLVVHCQDDGGTEALGLRPAGAPPDTLLDLSLVPEAGVTIDPGGVLFRLVVDHPVTSCGLDLFRPASALIESYREIFAEGARV